MKVEKVDPFDYPLRTKEEIMKDLAIRPELDYSLGVVSVTSGMEYDDKKDSRAVFVYLDIK
jgi:hypothetical protein